MSEISLLKDLFDTAVAASMPENCMDKYIPEPPKGRTLVVGAGKASAAMALALEKRWQGPLSGLVITRYGHGADLKQLEIVEAAHPVPDENGEKAAARILRLAHDLGPDDLMIALISGGGSALLSVPLPGLSLSDKQMVNQLLLKSGVAIGDMNILRKHLSAIKGGRLAQAAWPAKTRGLLISDVPGDDPATIASGPTAGDPSTLAEARRVLEKIGQPIPKNIVAVLNRSESESPNPHSPQLSTTTNTLIATPMQALRAAADHAESVGIKPIILGDALEGEARTLGRLMAKQAREYMGRKQPLVLLSGGETTVTLHGNGVGGRNVEFLMGLALGLESAPNIHAIACDTDGIDGAAEIAGAFVTPTTLERARSNGYSIETAMENSDGHGFFGRLGDQIITGPTRTNVNDFRAILIGP